MLLNGKFCFYFIGLSGSGKTTYANKLRSMLLAKDNMLMVTLLDGDDVRRNKKIGFSKKDRSDNVRHIGRLASEAIKKGHIAICANIAPYDEDRLANRTLITQLGARYIEIWINMPLEVCEKRDPKGLYKKARSGKISQFTGISDPFEAPTKSDFVITDEHDNLTGLFAYLKRLKTS